MKNDNVIEIRNPDPKFRDYLTEILKGGCRRIIAEALELELNDFLDSYRGLKGTDGKQRVVRNGYLPERDLQTGIGAVTVRVPRTRDRYRTSNRTIGFRSSILPPYLRKTRSIEELLPWLYLKGISTGDFKEALAVLVGEDAGGYQPIPLDG